ncbi:MAG: hypothetical protein IPK16_01570 [Anaerolineales bacterium]|nr:hypothetical protein [Anaerolineales bacterium]
MASVSRTGIGDGKVTAEAPGIDCGFDCAEDYPIGTTITLSATAFAGSLFSGWNGACTGATPTCTITLNSAHAVTAIFQPRMQYRLTTQVAGGAPGSVKVDPPGIISTGVYTGDFAHGTRITLTATPAPDSAFWAWYYGCTNSTASTCSFTMTSAMNVYAYFKPRRYHRHPHR